jgi:hypothetical protein
MKILLCISLISAVVMGACGSRTARELQSNDSLAQTIDEIVWESWGPPVAPQYNKTYKVILSRSQQTLAIDSLRSAGIEVTRKLQPKDFDQILALKSKCKIEIGAPLSFEGCMGGQGQTLTFLIKAEKIAEGRIVDCGGEQRSNIKGDVTTFVEGIRKLAFPE